MFAALSPAALSGNSKRGAHKWRWHRRVAVARTSGAGSGSSDARLMAELFQAYDADGDGMLSREEMWDFAQDLAGEDGDDEDSDDALPEALQFPPGFPVPGGARPSAPPVVSEAVANATPAPGRTPAELAALYAGKAEELRMDHARALAPRLEALLLLGAGAAVATARLGRALRRKLQGALAASKEGSCRLVEREVGVGPTRIRRGWLLASLGPFQETSAGLPPPTLQFVVPAGETALELEEWARHVMRLSSSGDVLEDAWHGFGGFRSLDGLKVSTSEDGTVGQSSDVPGGFNFGNVLGAAVRSMVPGLKVPGEQQEAAEKAARSAKDTEAERMAEAERRERRARAFAKALPSIFSVKTESKSDVDDGVESAYRSVRDFKVLREGDPAHVPIAAFRGNPDVRKQLEELVDLLKHPERYAKVGARPPKGVLLCGEPGTGKTFAARAVASEAGVPFLAISGSDFRQSPFSGVGTSMTLKMFEEARKRAPCVVFIDEIDSLGEARRQGPTAFQDAGEMGGSVTRDQDANLNALLAKMDGFQPSSGVLFLAATNRPEVLDEALLRSGRFDRRIEFRLPDAKGRAEILEGYAKGLTFDEAGRPDLTTLATKTPAFSPADLEGMLNRAATAAVTGGREAITAQDVEESLNEVRTRKAKARPEGAFQVTQVVEVGFSKIRGHDEAVEELRDLVDMLMNREKYEKVGAKPPRGVLLEGPPGVGKTHCARALAGEVGLPFLSASGSDFQASKYAGQGTQMVKKLFPWPRSCSPASSSSMRSTPWAAGGAMPPWARSRTARTP